MNTYMTDNNNFQNVQVIDVENTPEMRYFRLRMATHLGAASLIYAAFATFCLYKNLSGVTMPFFGIATLIYMIYGLRQYDVKLKRTSWFIGYVIMALAVCNFMTGNSTILFFNNVGIIFMIFLFMLHNVYDDSCWNFTKTLSAIFEAFVWSIAALADFALDMRILKQRSMEGYGKNIKKNYIKYILLGLLIAVPLVSILILLLSQADRVFGELLFKYLSFDIDIGSGIVITLTFCTAFFAGYCMIRCFSKKTIKEEYDVKRNLEPLVAITVLSIVSVIYLLFSVIQIVYLFMGQGNPPEGYTYAQYAREGFFQLLVVSLINFVMVIFINNRFRENRVLKVLLTIISLCTYIMIASSALRIKMYIDVYYLTELRIWVIWGLTVLTLLFAAVIVSIYKQDFPLFRYSIVVVSVLYIIIGYARPDYMIARYNLDQMNSVETSGLVSDYEYLKTLSTDAAPVIAETDFLFTDDTFEEEVKEAYFRRCRYFYENRSLRQFNISAYMAESSAEEYK